MTPRSFSIDAFALIAACAPIRSLAPGDRAAITFGTVDNYRLDNQSARRFLGQLVTLP